MANEDLVRQLMVQWSDIPSDRRENLLAALIASKVSSQVQGTSLVMDPQWAKMLEPVLNDPQMRDASIEALMRLEKGKQQPAAGSRPTELSIVLFASTPNPLDGNDANRYAREILGSKYGDSDLATRDMQFVTIPDLDPSLTLNDGIARAYYARLVELPQGKNWGEPDDAYSGKARDGTPVAALFFWHGSTGGQQKKRRLWRKK